MKLLLQKKVAGLGEVGDVVEISDGYGRNYLLPQRVAIPNTPENRRRVQADKLMAIQQEADRIKLATLTAKELKRSLMQVNLKCQEDGTLYGSVNAKVVADVVEKSKGYRIEERWVQLEKPIKKIGDYDITLKLPGDVEVVFKLTVLPDEG